MMVNLTDRDWLLYQQIQSFPIDAIDAQFSFSQRLARENRWSRAYALQAIEEYKKFVFLAMVAGHPVTPSEQVDQVWHLHLIYTQSYWQEFCGKILPRPLHHGPTRGGLQEHHKHVDWYEKTIASYERIFGVPAPIAVWPSSDRRFGHDVQAVRINLQDHWVIPKGILNADYWLGRSLQSGGQWIKTQIRLMVHSLRLNSVYLLGSCLLLMTVTLTGCTLGDNPFAILFSMPGPEFLLFYFQFGLGAIVLGYVFRWFAYRMGDSVAQRSQQKVLWISRDLFNLTLLLGIARLINGFINGRPIGFLIALLIVFFIFGGALWTPPGAVTWISPRATIATDMLMFSVVIYACIMVVASGFYSILCGDFTSSSRSSGGGSDGGSDGGGDGCGSGCGGCGGCGCE